MEDFLNILPVIIFVLIGVGGSVISAKQKRGRKAEQEEYEEYEEYEESETPESAEQPYIPVKPPVTEENYIPVREQLWKPQPLSRKKQRSSIIQSPELEGASAIERTEYDINADDPYAQHPDIPAADSDWRRAVLAHEILKTKF